ncbi:hypothetical protein WMY93_005666 [Mugilogobius chulae]|uniref:Uncharacterized protein n=1 Tax=Mugilogobius chulae TaxID=88201 RepID=A0AAW0PK89_9GOBI
MADIGRKQDFFWSKVREKNEERSTARLPAIADSKFQRPARRHRQAHPVGPGPAERYIKFVKERSEIEQSYAKQLRNLTKKYTKRGSKEEQECKFSNHASFQDILNELNDYAGQRELVAENMMTSICVELTKFLQEIKQERKSHLSDVKKSQQTLESSFKQLENSKKRFAKEWAEAEKATQQAEKTENDLNATRLDVEKAKHYAHSRTHAAEECRSDYAAQLQKYNKEQNYYYYTDIPQIFNDSILFIEQHKSGFERPADVEFEDYSQGIKPATSESSLNPPKVKGKLWIFSKKHKTCPTCLLLLLLLLLLPLLVLLLLLLISVPAPPAAASTPAPAAVPASASAALASAAPAASTPAAGSTPAVPAAPSPASAASAPVPAAAPSPAPADAPLAAALVPAVVTVHMLQLTTSGAEKHMPVESEDFSHLPPEQRKKKLQSKIDEISKELQKAQDSSDALEKMKGVYAQNPGLGDPSSLEPSISETAQKIGKLRGEVAKYETWLSEAMGGDDPSSPDSHHHTQRRGHSVHKPWRTAECHREDQGDGWMRVVKANGEEGYIPSSYVQPL